MFICRLVFPRPLCFRRCFFIHRNNSIKELEAFAENAIAVNRMILRHLSISEAHEPTSFKPWEDFEDSSGRGSSSSNKEPIFKMPDDKDDPIFHIGSDSDNEIFQLSDDENSDTAPVLWMGLSPPGASSLARRRAKKSSSDSSSTGSDTGSPRIHARSPPKAPSAMF